MVGSRAVYLVKGIIPKAGLVVVWGPPKCGKTFWSFDISMHVALGWEYRGHTVERGVVVYIAAEGERGFRARAQAFRQEHLSDNTARPDFYLIATRLSLAQEVDALIADIRATGARIRLIGDGDLSAGISAAVVGSGVHAVMGTGGAPEGVLAAAALACIGGQMQGRLVAVNEQQRERARAAGIVDLDRKYHIRDMVMGDLSFAATGITDGSLLEGVRFSKEAIFTHTLVMRASTRTVRWIKTEHPDINKFD
jgi:hypothetical protein